MENNNEDVKEVVLVYVDGDYDHLYIDGEEVSHDGRYDLPDYIDGELVRFVYRYRERSDQNYVNIFGQLPESLDELLEHEKTWEATQR